MQENLTYKLTQQDKVIQLATSISTNCVEFTKNILKYQKNINYAKMMQNYFKYEKIIMPRNICSKVFDKQFFFYCFDCQIFPNSCQCVQCFNKTNHQGHNFKKQYTDGGTCDCGDDQKWKVQSTCSDHKNQNILIEVNEQKTKIFIEEMKFCFFIQLLLEQQNAQEGNKLFQGISQFLYEFNDKSMISNEMTYRLLKQELTHSYFQQYKELTFQKATILQLIFTYCSKLKYTYEAIFMRLLQILLSRKQCRVFMTQKFNLSIIKTPIILLSPVQGLYHQLLTSYKVVERLIDENRLPPIVLKNFTGPSDPQLISQIYFVLYTIFEDMNQLKFEVNKKYFKHLLMNEDIVHLSGYEDPMLAKRQLRQIVQPQMKFYAIQFLYIKYLRFFLTHIQDQKQIIIKCLKDLINHFKTKISKGRVFSIILAKQRTFLLLIYYLTKGNIMEGMSKQLMQSIGLTQQIIFYIYERIFKAFIYYGICLSNFNMAIVYSQFYAFIFGNSQRILISIDFQILNFCMVVANKQTKQKIIKQNLNNMLLLYYQIGRLCATQQQQINQYKTQIAIQSLIFQNAITNHSPVTVKAHLNMISKQQSFQFYGQLIKSLKNVRLQQFYKITSIFLTQSNPFLQQFIQQYCKVDDYKINLLPSKQHLFHPINLSSLTTLKGCQILDPYLQNNFKQLGYGHSIESKRKQIFQYFNENFFNQNYYFLLMKIIDRSIQELTKFPQKQQQLGCLILWVQQMIRQFKINQNKTLHKIFELLKSKQNIFKKLSNLIQKEIFSFLSIKQKNEEIDIKVVEQSKTKNQLKSKKLYGMKEKQNKFLQGFNLIKDTEEQNQHNKQKPICMMCKVSDEEQPLSLLCFSQQSNLFSNFYLGSNFSTQFITTCNHFAHYLCIAQRYQQGYQIRCEFCKTTTNLQLVLNLKQQINLIKQQKINKKLNIEIKQEQKKVQSIAIQVLYGLFVNYEFFINSLAPVCCSLLSQLTDKSVNLQLIIKHLQIQKNNSILNQKKQKNWNILMGIVKQIVFYIENKQFNGKLLGNDLKDVSNCFEEDVYFVLKGIKNYYLLSTLKTKNIVPIQPIKFRNLQKNLKDLNKLLGKCPNCHKVTNEIGLCLICQFKSCIGCQVENLTTHTNKCHCGKSIFIRADNGLPIYLSSNRAGHMNPIYFNMLHLPNDEDSKKRQQYNLDMKSLQKIEGDLIKHHVEQQMRYNEVNQQIKFIAMF